MKSIWLASLAVCLFLFMTCSKNVGINNTKTEPRIIPAMLYNPGGSPAVHAKVRFFPINYNPHAGGLTKKFGAADSAATDSTGNYSVKLDTGTYNVLASGDSGVVYQDSITVTNDSAIHPPADTLKTPGGLRGKVRLQPGDDARTVFILFMGTNTWGTPDDSTGKFTVANMAQGTYRVRILTTLDAYVPKDTVLSVTAGVVDSLPHDIVLKYTGIPGPTGLTVSYDTLRQTVILAWIGADTSLITGYNVYRAIKGQNLTLITQTPLPDTVTTYRDSTVSVGTIYQYEVVSFRSGQESPKVIIPGDTMKALSSSLVTTTFTCNLNNAISDTASINDTIKACLTYSNPSRKIVKIVWYVDSLNSPVLRQKSDSSLTGKDTLAYSWNQTGNKKIFVKATDAAGTVWTDTLGVIIIQDAPVITFISADTTVNHGGTVRCSVYVQQEFGTMTVGIDTANSGTFKSLGGLSLSGGKSYSFSTGSACMWDSVKVRVTDSKGNVVTKGFKIQIRISPPTIQKINSDTAIAIKDSVTFNVSAIDSFGSITQIAWDFDGNGMYDWTSSTLLSCGYRYQTVGKYKAVLRLTDECQKLTYDTVGVTVLQDIPGITFLSADTTVNHGGVVRCSVYVRQQFGTMTVAIDTANSGNYKPLGNLGLSGGESYSFSTGNACSWDSVKVRVTDSKGNVVSKGFKVQLLYSPPVIQKVNPDTTMAIKDSLTFNVSATAPDGSITQMAWDFDGNGVYDWTSSTLQNSGYRYQAAGLYKAVLRLTDECQKQTYDTVKVTVVQDMPIPNAGADTTVSIKDTIKLHGSASHQFGTITEWAWDIGNTGTFKVTSKGDTNIIAPVSENLNYLCVLRVTDSHGNVVKDTVKITVLKDVPIIKFLSADTVVDHSGMVRCSVYVQQQFGTMTVRIDTANSGNYKSLGNLGLSGGESCSLSTGNACAWDSVKVRVTDSKGNVVAKGFRVRIRPRSLTITSVDSTINTITVNYSQSQETDFAQYRIYRNTTNAVDTTSELWATITMGSTVSYTTPSPSYAWNPRYYRVYQRDNEGLWSAGSNVVFGCIVNSPPSTPVIRYPANDGDSIWSDATIRWSKSIDPNGNGVRYRLLVNYNNTIYTQFATALTDTFVQLSGYDSLLLKFKVIAYDTLGDSSAWSSERIANIRVLVTDIDGNVYRTVRIGNQFWTMENLRTTKYNDGTEIPLTTDAVQWQNLTTPGYCWSNNDSATSYTNSYGALYNWYTVNTYKLAPMGWHLPTNDEWETLQNYLIANGYNWDGTTTGNKIAKSLAAEEDWITSTLNGTPGNNLTTNNKSGFSGRPGGCRDETGGFCTIGHVAYWWSATETDASTAYIGGYLYYNWVYFQTTTAAPKNNGFPVRLLRD